MNKPNLEPRKLNTPDGECLQTRLFDLICNSQDGNPARALRAELGDGRLVNVSDNLNRLLADAINNATESGDIETLRDDLNYAAAQLIRAAGAVNSRYFTGAARKAVAA